MEFPEERDEIKSFDRTMEKNGFEVYIVLDEKSHFQDISISKSLSVTPLLGHLDLLKLQDPVAYGQSVPRLEKDITIHSSSTVSYRSPPPLHQSHLCTQPVRPPLFDAHIDRKC